MMPIIRKLLAAAAPLALLAASACAPSFEANVSRFQALPVPEGQSFVIVPTDPRNQGGLEFGQYSSLVSQRLAAYGYRPVDGAGKPDMVVGDDLDIDDVHGAQAAVVSQVDIEVAAAHLGGADE